MFGAASLLGLPRLCESAATESLTFADAFSNLKRSNGDRLTSSVQRELLNYTWVNSFHFLPSPSLPTPSHYGSLAASN